MKHLRKIGKAVEKGAQDIRDAVREAGGAEPLKSVNQRIEQRREMDERLLQQQREAQEILKQQQRPHYTNPPSLLPDGTLPKIKKSSLVLSDPPLGSGSTASVYNVIPPNENTPPAAAKLYHTHIVRDSTVQRELRGIRRMTGSPFVVATLAIVVDDEDQVVGFIMEKMGKPIADHSFSDGAAGCHEKQKMFLKVAHAVDHAHDDGLILADIKPGNILFSLDGEDVKLCDLGCSHVLNTASATSGSSVRGTPIFTAPECDECPPTKQSDVFSFGMTMWSVLHPKDTDHGLGATLRAIAVKLSRGDRPAFTNPDIPTHLRQLIQRCWDADPVKRPSFEEIIRCLRPDEERRIDRHNEMLRNRFQATKTFLETILRQSNVSEERILLLCTDAIIDHIINSDGLRSSVADSVFRMAEGDVVASMSEKEILTDSVLIGILVSAVSAAKNSNINNSSGSSSNQQQSTRTNDSVHNGNNQNNGASTTCSNEVPETECGDVHSIAQSTVVSVGSNTVSYVDHDTA